MVQLYLNVNSGHSSPGHSNTMDVQESEYGQLHRSILVHLLFSEAGVVRMAELRTFITDTVKISTEVAEALDIREIINTINKKTENIHKLRIVNNEMTCESEVVLMWLANGEALKAHSGFTAQELEYFRLLMEKIVVNDQKFISSIDAINLVTKNLTKTNAQDLLTKWCKMRYLKNIENVGYVLDTRAIHELEPYFIQNMKSLMDECNICKRIVFQSIVCPHCMESLHKTCLGKYVNHVKKWPCCKNILKENVNKLPTIIDTKFTTLSQESQTTGECSGSSQRKRKTMN